MQAGADGFGTTATRGTKVITCTIWLISLTTGPVPFSVQRAGQARHRLADLHGGAPRRQELLYSLWD